MKEIELVIDYVLHMIEQNKYTELKHSLKNLKTSLPFIDYFKREEYLNEYLKIKEETENA